MQLRLLAAAISVGISLIPNIGLSQLQPLWVNLGSSQNGELFIDQLSIAKHKTVVKFDMRLVESERLTSARVVAECNSLSFQYQNKAINNIASPPPNGIEFPIQQTEPDTILATAIYYACSTYQP